MAQHAASANTNRSVALIPALSDKSSPAGERNPAPAARVPLFRAALDTRMEVPPWYDV